MSYHAHYSDSCSLSLTAQHAIRAAKMRRSIGRWAARQYCIKRGVPMSLYRLASQLEAAERS